MPSTGRVDWARLTRDEFERLVHVLVGRDGRRRSMLVEPIDGRGGDAGIDIRVTDPTDGSLAIYQLKHFPEGFAGSWAHRKRQISKSLSTAMQHAPTKWVLVVPTLGTASERDWVASLGIECAVAVEFCGTSELDLLLIENPSVVEWWTGDTLREALQTVGRDTAALQKVDDVIHEAERLGNRASHMSDNWAVEVTSGAGRTAIRYVPRHDHAAVAEPLRVALALSFGDEHEELRKRWSDLSEFGYVDSITLPADVATGFSQRGPAWFTRELGPGELTIGPSAQPSESSVQGMRIVLTALDEAGNSLASVAGESVSLHHGDVGSTLVISFVGGLTTRWRMARPPRADASASFEVKLAGQDVLTAERVVRFLESLPLAQKVRMEAPELGLHDQVTVTSTEASVGERGSVIHDLAAISRLLDQQIIVPENFAESDLARYRAARLLLEGRTVVLPGTRSIDFAIDGDPDSAFVNRLRDGESIAITGVAVLPVGSVSVPIGEVKYFIPDGKVADYAELAEWASGVRRRAQVSVRSPSGDGVHAKIPSRLAEDGPAVSLPIGFRGFD